MRLAGFDHLAFAHQDFRHHAAVDRLHDLHLARRDDLAGAAGDLVDRRERGPQQTGEQDDSDRAQQIARAQRLLVEPRPVGVGRPSQRIIRARRNPAGKQAIHQRPRVFGPAG